MRNPDNFELYELVSEDVYELLGEQGWKLFHMPFIYDVDKLVTDVKRDLGCTAATVNTWRWAGDAGYTQSGFREYNNGEGFGSAGSQHRSGNALDLKFEGCSIKDVYDYMVENQVRYPYINRVENIEVTKTWLHLDGKTGSGTQLYVFNP